MRHPVPFLLLLVLLPFVLLTGCLSVLGKDRQPVLIETEPAGAEAVSTEGERCITPCTLDLPKMKEQAVWLEKVGFLPQEMTLTGERSGKATAASVAGNLVLGTTLWIAGGALLFGGQVEPGVGLIGTGLFIAFGGGALTDREGGAHLRLTPNSLRGVLVPESLPTESAEDVSGARAAPDRE